MMDLLNQKTSVTFPLGSVHETGKILYAEAKELPVSEGNNLLIITDTTPFHPIGYSWPDQPGDTGYITISGSTLPVINSITAAYHTPTGRISFDKDISVRRGDAEWLFHVVHIVSLSQKVDVAELVGEEAILDVDEHYRNALSAAHTSCHLFALALNKLTKELWTKETRPDGLGNPNLDQVAIQKSLIGLDKSTDIYRFGKSVRKAGFASEQFFAQLDNLRGGIERQISQWIGAGFKVQMTTEGAELDSRRYWEASLSDGQARIPCGGTHIKSSDEFSSISVVFDQNKEDSELTVFTVPH